MDAIMLCMKKRGIRFFSKIMFPNTEVCRFYGKKHFLGFLRKRKNFFDNVLIIAHGSDRCILTTTNNPPNYIEYITDNEADAFINNFVFAVSCSTANAFGRRCVEAGAVAYLGYEVQFGFLFSSYSSENPNIPKSVTSAVDTIIKHIFVEELSRAYEEFLTKPVNVQYLKQKFSFLLEKRIVALTSLDAAQRYIEYGVKITDQRRDSFFAEIALRVLSSLDEITQRLVCIGDSNYVSPSYKNHQ